VTAPASPSWRYGGVLLGVGAALRIAYHVPLRLSDPTYFTPHGNAAGFVRLARLVASGDLLAGREPFFYGPLYPYFLAACWWTSGGECYVAPRVVQAALGLATAWLVYLVGRACFDELAARAAGLLFVACPTGLFFEGMLVSTTLETFLLALAAWLLLRRWPAPDSASRVAPPPGHLAGAGAALGLCAWGRGNVLLLLPVVAAGLAAATFTRTRGAPLPARLRRALAPAAILAAGMGLVVAPVTLRNAIAGGDAVLLVSQGGINLFAGNNPEARGVFALPERAGIVTDADGAYYRNTAEVAERELGRSLRPSEVSAYWTRRAVAWAREHPLDCARLTLRKARLLLDPYEVPIHQNAQFYRQATPLSWLPLPGWGLLLPLAVAGGALDGARGRAGLLALPAAAYLATVLPFFVTDRYRFPVVALLAPLAGRGLVGLAQVVTHRARRAAWPTDARRALTAAAVAGLLALAVNAAALVPSWSPFTPEMRARYLALEHHRHGEAEAARGRSDAALAHHERALAASPGHVPSRIARARLLAERGRGDEAVADLRTLLSLQPGNAEARRLLDELTAAPTGPQPP
jgi:tetratricopeptide (TPR) repeat protein